MILEIGTVFRWINFPVPRYGEQEKPRWFICIGFSSIVSGIEDIYLCTTTTQLNSFKSSGSRKGHRHFIFNTDKFPFFDEDCIIDFDEKPYTISKEKLNKCKDDISIKGKLDNNTLIMIYNYFFLSNNISLLELHDIHTSYNNAGITGLKKPRPYKK